MKPILATDLDLSKLTFPLIAMPKIDGVRALNVDGKLVARSGKPFKNIMNSEYFNQTHFAGLDGEMVVDRICGYGICNETTSALSTIKGTVPTRWCLFDYTSYDNPNEPYQERYRNLVNWVEILYQQDPSYMDRIWVIPIQEVKTAEELDQFEISCIQQGYEGIILRSPEGPYKFGRSTAKENYFLRLKRFMDAEIQITELREGQTNHNKQTQNPHGYAERATLAENMEPNGMIGTIIGIATSDIVFNDEVLIKGGETIEVSPGKMSHEDRKYYFKNQSEILGKIAKFQYFPIGVKDKLRFPTFQCFRQAEDM